MKNNKLIISAAGSGKTTFLVDEALKKDKKERILIATYTVENETEIRKKILEKRKAIPSNITIQGWFSFLIQEGVKPYQGSMNEMLFANDINGMLLSEGRSGKKYYSNGKPVIANGHPQYFPEKNFRKFYFSKSWRIYSDKVSKFIFECNKKVDGDIFSRISRIYSHIFIDEVQDLAGFDLELIKLLFKSSTNVLLVGDPRQVTYLTNHYFKHPKYKSGKIKEFLLDKCKSLLGDDSIDETTLKNSHRNNKPICDYSSRLYSSMEKSEPCDCEDCRSNETEHEGVFIVRPEEVNLYLDSYNPVLLKWDSRTPVNSNFQSYNFGQSKGRSFDRTFIYPTPQMMKWIKDNSYDFTRIVKGSVKPIIGVREKFYVALTRARHSVAIKYPYTDDEVLEGVTKWQS